MASSFTVQLEEMLRANAPCFLVGLSAGSMWLKMCPPRTWRGLKMCPPRTWRGGIVPPPPPSKDYTHNITYLYQHTTRTVVIRQCGAEYTELVWRTM